MELVYWIWHKPKKMNTRMKSAIFKNVKFILEVIKIANEVKHK